MPLSPLILNLLLLAGSLAVIYKASQFVIKYAVQLAARIHVSELTIGFLLVSLSTSLPELVVSVIASVNHGSDLAFGTVFGANIADVALVLGATAIFATIVINPETLRNLTLILLGTSLMSLLLLLYNPGRWTGIFFIIIFLFYVFTTLTKKHKIEVEEPKKFHGRGLPKELLLFTVSTAAVILGAQIAVNSTIEISKIAGLSQTLIGATLIAVGTTLPELSISILSVREKHYSLAVGNVIGSCIVNLSLVLGISLLIAPVYAVSNYMRLIVFSVIANISLLYFLQVKRSFGKREGVLLILGYIAFVALFVYGQTALI
ncbi:MAG: sodium:calcium antiporter [Candidatus Diapherotrites archaeon]|nr:sodium:calcium antiporter [Candidatus Diapherotrites archaeon]